MPANRDNIPADTERLVRTRAGHKCSVDGETGALEIAHIIEYAKTKDHSPENLLLMCALCHTRSHGEKWDRKTLRYYRDNPFVNRDKGFVRRIQNLRYSTIGQDFVGREDTLALLHESLSKGQATVLKGHVIHGMGGVGKTRAAIEYAWRFQAQYKAMLLVDADSPAALSRSIAMLCGDLILDLPEKISSDQNVQETSVLRWLQSRDDWLIIIDNADNDDSLAAIDALLPSLARGHVLVTTRLTNLSGSFAEFSLDVLSEAAATAYLLQRTHDRRASKPDDAVHVVELVHLLDGLALALEQAVAYIQKYRISFSEYLVYWKAHTVDAIRWHDGKKMHYPRSLAITYDTSVAQLSKDAKQLLMILSWFGPDPIPLSIFEANGCPVDLRSHLAELENLSLAKRRDDQSAFTIHRLLQEITRQQQLDEQPPEALSLALQWLSLVWDVHPLRPSEWHHLDSLVPHAERIGHFGIEFDIYMPTSIILRNLGIILHGRAAHLSAESLWRKIVKLDEKHAGESELHIIALNYLAIVLVELGHYSEAEGIYLRSLDILSRRSDLERSSQASTLRNLAKLHFKTNKTDEAEAEFRQALDILQSLDSDNKSTIGVLLNDLGELLLKANKLTDGEAMIRCGIKMLESNQDTYSIEGGLNNLAQALEASGRLEDAEELYRKSLKLSELTYGVNHPSVAVRLNNLGNILRATQREAEAEILHRRALEIDEFTYGPRHIEVATDLLNLGGTLQSLSRLEEAESVLRRSLEIWESIFGSDHSGVALCCNNLACVLYAQGNRLEAESLYVRAKMIHEAMLGYDHPAVATDLYNLAELYSLTDRLDQANVFYRRALKIIVRASQENGVISKDLDRRVRGYAAFLAEIGYSKESMAKKINKILRPIKQVVKFQNED